jgi:outer membrane protein assembly factor BamB
MELDHKVKHLFLLTTLASLSFFLSACSGQQSFPGSQLLGGDKTARAIPLDALKKVTKSINAIKVWEVKTGSAMGENKVHPFINGNTVYVAGAQTASAWNKESGKLIWKTSIGETISAGVNGAFSGTSTHIYLGTVSGNAIALDASTGKVHWIERLTSEVLSVSANKDDRVVFRTNDGKLHGLSVSTGELIWKHSQSSPALTHLGASVPVIVNDHVIAGFDNGKIAAYQLSTGKQAWETTLALPRGLTELDRTIDIDGKIKVLGTALFASSLNGNAIGLEADAGNPVWLKPFSSSTGITANSDGLYSSDDKGNIWKLAPQTGEPLWKMDDLVRREPTLPSLASPSLLVVGDKQGNIHWVNAKSGKFVARIKGDLAGYSVEPEISDKGIYTIGKSGVLTKLTIQ